MKTQTMECNSFLSLMDLYASTTEFHHEKDFEPSIVEPCHNLSLEEIIRDYSRGIIHSERQAFYDDGDDIPDEPPEVIEDFSEILQAPYNNLGIDSSGNNDSNHVSREGSARAGQKPSASSERKTEGTQVTDGMSEETGDGDDLG